MNLVNALHLWEMVDVTGIEPATPSCPPPVSGLFFMRGVLTTWYRLLFHVFGCNERKLLKRASSWSGGSRTPPRCGGVRCCIGGFFIAKVGGRVGEAMAIVSGCVRCA